MAPVEDLTSLAASEHYERGHYAPSRRSGPVAFVASLSVMLAVVAALATINVVAKHQVKPRLTVVDMEELDTAPPPTPPATRLDQPVEQPPQAFIPKPKIQLPLPGPTQIALEAPPLVQAPQVIVAKFAPDSAGPATAPSAAPASAAPAEGGDLSSQVISAKPPAYPVESRRKREQGTVKLLLLVGPDGRVVDIQVASSSGSERLDKAALTAVRRWRWAPLKRDGAPVAVRGYVTIPFVLV
ncbi:energy transducer TonB [Novosphingobium sp. RD2P27]|uniref:Protein TonB n=1 Tax=Novosphingobium kalidii TaxID=3230299 RepID=A0ABV2CZH3_9SPHN